MKKTIFIFLLFLSINACLKKNFNSVKTKTKKPNFECNPITPIVGITHGWQFRTGKNLKTHPYFNPNNGNEFVYLEEKGNLNEVYVYNILNKRKKLVYKGIPNRQLEWTTNNWILFNAENLMKIRPNGTNLKKITKIKFYFTTDKDKILYEKRESTLSNNVFYFSDTNNNIYDSIVSNYCGSRFDWAGDKIAYLPKTYNIKTKEVTEYFQDYDLTIATKPKWINSNEFIWSNQKNIFKTNTHTNKTDTIVSHCNAFKYSSFDYSPQLDKLICHRLSITKIKNDTKHIEVHIFMMNTNGTEIELIDIDNEFY